MFPLLAWGQSEARAKARWRYSMGDVGFVCQSFVIITLHKANNRMPLFEKKWHKVAYDDNNNNNRDAYHISHGG